MRTGSRLLVSDKVMSMLILKVHMLGTEAEQIPTSRHGRRIEMDTCNLQAQAALCAGAYEDANSSYRRAAELAVADGFPGLAAIFLSYTVDCGLLGGATDEEVMPTAEESVALARRSGMPGAIALSLASLALTLVERDPARARALLRECVELSSTPGEEISTWTSPCLLGRRSPSRMGAHARTDGPDAGAMAVEHLAHAVRAVSGVVCTLIRGGPARSRMRAARRGLQRIPPYQPESRKHARTAGRAGRLTHQPLPSSPTRDRRPRRNLTQRCPQRASYVPKAPR